MMVYLWDAPGPDCHRSGVSSSLGGALETAGEWLVSRRASSARVEVALLGICPQTLEPVYKRTGQAWQARHGNGGRARWEPLELAQACGGAPGRQGGAIMTAFRSSERKDR
jgi:hypothetical protein